MGPKPKIVDKSSSKKNLIAGKTRSCKKNTGSSYLADDQNFKPFTSQLNKLGLQLRDITGDGNCCFRALSDQLEGNENQHLDYRKRTCQYIRQNRDEFEPFIAALVEDAAEVDLSGKSDNKKKSNKKLDAFDNYIKNLETPGTYADNMCLVAFARLYQVTINIHQLDLPIWTIQGLENKSKKNIHLAYHNGEHYSSIRRQGDLTSTPTEINFDNAHTSQSANEKKPKKSGATASYIDEETHDINVDKIMNVTNCCDINLINEKLLLNENDVEATINDLIAELKLNGGSGGSDSGSESSMGKSNKSKKNSGKVSKADKKREKKERAMERQRSKFLELKENANKQNASNKSTKSSASNENIPASSSKSSENGNAFLISSSEIQSI